VAEREPGVTAEQRVLDDRARALAVPRRVEEDGSEIRDVVAFAVGAERYAIEIGFVREVRPLEKGVFCRVPCAPPFVVGIVNVRGRIFGVLDLGAYCGLAPRPLTESAHILIVSTSGQGSAGRETGILADGKPENQRIRGDRLRPPPEAVSAGLQGFIHGVTEEMLVFLDIGRLLDDPKMIVRDRE